MKTVDKVLNALFVALVCLCIVIHFCDGNSSAGIAWINVGIWFAVALSNRRRAEIYMDRYEEIRDCALDLIKNAQEFIGFVRDMPETQEQPEPPKEGQNEP